MRLQSFARFLESRGHLVRVRRPVDTKFEIAAVVKELKGKPVLFEQVKGHNMPVISNICATRDLVSYGLGIERKQLIARLTDAVESPIAPKVTTMDGYLEIEPDLGRLPILTYYPADGGPYIASGIAVAEDPLYGINTSFHRAMVKSKNELVLRILDRHLKAFMERGLKRFAFCVGNSIPVLLASAISAELGKSELAIANALGETLLAPFNGQLAPLSEIIMLCEFRDELADEGPFLDLTETFDIVRKQSVARVTQIFVRKNALFHALLPGDLEHKMLMGMPREPTIFREVSRVCECLDVHITPGGCSWLHGAVKIRKHSPEDGKKAIEAAFKGHPSMKHVFVVDEDIDIEDPRQLEWAMATRFQADRDLVVKSGEKGSSLDPSSDMETRETSKVGFDLTVPASAQKNAFIRPAPPLQINLKEYLED